MKAIMKRVLKVVMVMALVVISCAGCDPEPPAYSVSKKEFFYSTDNGSSYGNRRIEFEVGKSVYMQLVINVKSDDEKSHDITGHLKIPNVKSVDAHYLKGQKITPNQDDISGFTIYPFNITTNEDWTFFFEFVPNNVETLQMELLFDDPVPDKYDDINTIKIVTGTPKENNDDVEPTKEGE